MGKRKDRLYRGNVANREKTETAIFYPAAPKKRGGKGNCSSDDVERNAAQIGGDRDVGEKNGKGKKRRPCLHRHLKGGYYRGGTWGI